MAHNVRLRALGFWTLGSVVDPAEFESFDQSRYESITELGGTWTMASRMMLGGAGVEFDCAVAGAWDLTDGISCSGGGGFLFAAGCPLQTNGTLTIRNGAHLVVASGGDSTYQSGSSATWASGTTATIAAGAVLDVLGVVNFESLSGWTLKTGSLGTVAASASINVVGQITIASGGVVELQSGSVVHSTAGSTFTGSMSITGGVTRTGPETLVGPGATTAVRTTALAGLGAGNMSINHADNDVSEVPGTLGGTRFLTLKTASTGSNPPTNSVARYRRMAAPDAFLLHIQDDVGNPIVDFLASKRAFADIRWNGSAYVVDAASQHPTDVTVY